MLPLSDVVTLLPGWWDGSAVALENWAQRFRHADVPVPFSLTLPDGTIATDIDARVVRDGAITLVGLQRDPDRLGNAGGAQDVLLTSPRPALIYDLRRHVALGRTDRVALSVGSTEPVMLALSPVPVPPLALSGPLTAQAGETVVLGIGWRSVMPSAVDVVHVQTLDPDGDTIAAYSGNLTLRHGSARWRLPFAVNDRAGIWTIRVTDQLGADVRVWRIAVRPDAPG